MKNSRSEPPNGWALQLAPMPLKRLLSETNSFQLEGPNSKPLQLEYPASWSSCSELKEKEPRPPEPSSFSQLPKAAPPSQLASDSLPEAPERRELKPDDSANPLDPPKPPDQSP